MEILEFTYALLDEVAVLVFANHDELDAGMFDSWGAPLAWPSRPHVKAFVGKRKKKPKPRADISALQPGALVLSQKAKTALGEFLSQFGQLLELDCDGAVEYFYNVTNIIDCIDFEKSLKRPEGTIAKEVFFPDRLPMAPVLFKDPRTARGRIYANEPAKAVLEKLIDDAGITGAAFVELGPPPPRPRPTA